jgi:hypothetical protein
MFLIVLFIKNFGKKSIYPETFLFMMIWTLPTLYGSIWAVRFAMLLALPLSICAGISLGILIDYGISLIKKYNGRGNNKYYLLPIGLGILGSIIGLVTQNTIPAFLGIIGGGFSYFIKIDREFAKKLLILGILITLSNILIISIIFPFYDSSYKMAKSYGTSISKNWADSMNWLKQNTPECTVVATYWDPGYWIAALSGRKTIFDGGLQNSLKHTKLEDLNGLDCIEDRKGYIEEINGTKYCVTSRIQDMAGVLYTSDEVWAAKVLETYMEGPLGSCNDLYELASDELIQISHWWTYFSNWDPEKGKGQGYGYMLSPFQEQKPLMLEKGTALIYGPFILKITNENGSQKLEPLILEQGNYYKIKNLVLVINGSITTLTYLDGTVPGTLWVSVDGTPLSMPKNKCTRVNNNVFCLSHINIQNFCLPTTGEYSLCRPYAIYMREQTENSLFTKMFFYNGAGLNYFEPSYINNSQVKLFKFKVEEFRKDLEEGVI